MFGELFSTNIKKLNYLDILKSNISFQEKNEDKDLYLNLAFKEIGIKEKVVVKEEIKDLEEVSEMTNDLPDELPTESEESKAPVPEVTSQTEYPVQTTIIQANNLPENYNTIYNSVKIKNETSFNLSESILTPNVNFSSKDIIIFHTHTCESYTSTKENSYTPSGNYRTIDLNYSVVRVGTELNNCLTQKGINVIHNTSYHDYPAYNGSYSRSFKTVQNILEKTSGIQLVIDLHRDAVGSMNNYAPSVKIGDEQVAQLMFVMGTNGGGLDHPNWQTNLKFAIKIQEKANEMYPGLFRPIILRNSRYNQNLADAACIIEVGATRKYIRRGNWCNEIFGRSSSKCYAIKNT